jgi:hypothetical protein
MGEHHGHPLEPAARLRFQPWMQDARTRPRRAWLFLPAALSTASCGLVQTEGSLAEETESRRTAFLDANPPGTSSKDAEAWAVAHGYECGRQHPTGGVAADPPLPIGFLGYLRCSRLVSGPVGLEERVGHWEVECPVYGRMWDRDSEVRTCALDLRLRYY